MPSSINNQITTFFNVKSVAPAGLKLHELKPYQVGLFDEKTQRTVSEVSDCRGAKFSFVWKSPSKGTQGPFPDLFDQAKPIKSLEIDYVDRVHLFDKATSERKPFVGYLGFNGVSPCDSLQFKCGTSYELVIHVSGKPVRDLHGRELTEYISFTTGCCDNCAVDENCKVTMDKIVKEVSNQAFYTKRFFDIDSVVSCCPPASPFPKVDFFDFCMEICDTGDESALADVQIQYQNLDVCRVKREGAISTYKVECVLTAPADYVQTGNKLPDCDVCPAGYTAVPGSKKYLVTIDNAGVGVTAADWLAEVQAAGAFSVATEAKRLSRNGSVSVYEVLVPTTFVEPTAPIAETTYTFISDVKPYCVQDTPITVSWAQCGEKYKISRTLCMTLKNGDCGNPAADLAEVTAYYAQFPDIVPGSLIQTGTNDCLTTYEIQQYSNCLEDGCDTIGANKAKFADLPGYKTGYWATCKCEGWTVDVDGCPVPPELTADNCQCGLKFTGKMFDTDRIPCASDIWDEPETEGVTLEVSISERGVTGCEAMNVSWTVAQQPTYQNGSGVEYLRTEVQSREYQGYQYISNRDFDGAMIAARRGEVYTIDPDKFYNHISLYHDYNIPRRSAGTKGYDREMIMLVVEEHKTELLNQLKTMVNGILVKQGSCDFI